MGKNKVLEKFKDSKIPKKGEGIAIQTQHVYEYPNTNSKIIGNVQKGELTEWISKTICQGNEWVRCGAKKLFGYLIGINSDGNYNFDKIEQIPKKETINEKPVFPKDEVDKVMQAKNQVMHSLELGNFGLELKNDYNPIDPPKDTNPEEIPIVHGLDDLEKGQEEKNLYDTFKSPNISQQIKLQKETEKLVQELLKKSSFSNSSSTSISSSTSSSISSSLSATSTFIKDNVLSICNYTEEFLCLNSSKFGSLIYIKYEWKFYKLKQVDLKTARSVTCRINSSTISDTKFISKLYGVCGIVTSSLDCFISCMNIINNNNYSDYEKFKEVTKKIGGNVGAITGGIVLKKRIDKIRKATKFIFKGFMKVLKISKKVSPLNIVLGFGFDCFVNFFTGTTFDCLVEEILDKIFNIFN